MLIFVSIIMTAIFSFSAGKVVYDPSIHKPLKIEHVSKLDVVYDVATTKITLDK